MDDNNTLVASGGEYLTENISTTENLCIPDGCYTLTVYDTFNNGMCPFQSNAVGVSTFITPGTLITPGSIVGTLSLVASPGLCGNYNLTDASDNTVLNGGGSFGASQSNSFCLVNGVPQRTVSPKDDFISITQSDVVHTHWEIYPTLAYDFLTVDFRSIVVNQLNLININGQVLQQFIIEENDDQPFTINLKDVPLGINFIQIVTESGVVASKTFVRQ